MRLVIQRVLEANVKVGDKLVGKINRGLLVLIGINSFDTYKESDYLSKKLLNLRIWTDETTNKRWNKSVMDLKYEILCVSQFTLYSVLKGNKPDFHLAMEPEKAKELYNYFVDSLRKSYNPNMIQEGEFGGYMLVSSTNDGPVTINLEYPENDKSENNNLDIKSEKTDKKENKNNDKSKNKQAKNEKDCKKIIEKNENILIDKNGDKLDNTNVSEDKKEKLDCIDDASK